MGLMSSAPSVKQRVCLKCDQPFRSFGPGNRICSRCRRVNRRLLMRPERLIERERGRKYHNGELLGGDLEDQP